MRQYKIELQLEELAHATAHLLHGSSEGRFKITYAPAFLSKGESEQDHFSYADLSAAIDRYRPDERKEGSNTTDDGEEFYFRPTPSAGL